MRHRVKTNALGRTASHKKAMISNMAASLIKHKRIKTTLAKAKVLKTYIEPIVTKAKEDTTPNRRLAFSFLQDKYAVTELFRTIAVKVGDRPGGYTRILKIGHRSGDNAQICYVEFVDFNTTYTPNVKTTKKRRTRRGSKNESNEVSKQVVPELKNEVVESKEEKIIE
jgi:large subunit ribosomal protein L17